MRIPRELGQTVDEKFVAGRFVAYMAQRGVTIAIQGRGDPDPDFVASVNGEPGGIEITRAVVRNLKELKTTQQERLRADPQNRGILLSSSGLDPAMAQVIGQQMDMTVLPRLLEEAAKGKCDTMHYGYRRNVWVVIDASQYLLPDHGQAPALAAAARVPSSCAPFAGVYVYFALEEIPGEPFWRRDFYALCGK